MSLPVGEDVALTVHSGMSPGLGQPVGEGSREGVHHVAASVVEAEQAPDPSRSRGGYRRVGDRKCVDDDGPDSLGVGEVLVGPSVILPAGGRVATPERYSRGLGLVRLGRAGGEGAVEASLHFVGGGGVIAGGGVAAGVRVSRST